MNADDLATKIKSHPMWRHRQGDDALTAAVVAVQVLAPKLLPVESIVLAIARNCVLDDRPLAGSNMLAVLVATIDRLTEGTTP